MKPGNATGEAFGSFFLVLLGGEPQPMDYPAFGVFVRDPRLGGVPTNTAYQRQSPSEEAR